MVFRCSQMFLRKRYGSISELRLLIHRCAEYLNLVLGIFTDLVLRVYLIRIDLLCIALENIIFSMLTFVFITLSLVLRAEQVSYVRSQLHSLSQW